MEIFLDTEFTDFTHDRQLISLGMVADSGEEIYVELPFEIKKCSEFVIDNVIPLLGREPLAQCQLDEIRQRILTWFSIVRRKDEIIEICTDSESDWNLLLKAVDYNLPSHIKYKNIENNLSYHLMFDFWEKTGLPEHHALYDAKANKHAYRKK